MPVPASVSFMLLGTVRGRDLLLFFSNQFLSYLEISVFLGMIDEIVYHHATTIPIFLCSIQSLVVHVVGFIGVGWLEKAFRVRFLKDKYRYSIFCQHYLHVFSLTPFSHGSFSSFLSPFLYAFSFCLFVCLLDFQSGP